MSALAKLALIAAIALAAAPAAAMPIVLGVDPAASDVTASIGAPFPSAPQQIGVTGSLSFEIQLVDDPFDGLLASALSSDGGMLAFSDATYVLATPPGVSLSVSGTGVGAGVLGPMRMGFPFGPGTSLFDLFGYTLSLNVGTLTGVGDSLGSPLDFSTDLGAAPLVFVYPLDSIAQLVLVDHGDDTFDATLLFPFDAQVTLAPSGIETTFALEGQLVLTGIASIPEPASGLLLAGGLATLATRRRSRGRRA